MNQNIKCIAKHYGFQHQAIKTVEKCSKFITTLSKLANGEGSWAYVVEEMADVMVMLQQMQYFLCIDLSELHKAIDVKVKRQSERMNQH